MKRVTPRARIDEGTGCRSTHDRAAAPSPPILSARSPSCADRPTLRPEPASWRRPLVEGAAVGPVDHYEVARSVSAWSENASKRSKGLSGRSPPLAHQPRYLHRRESTTSARAA